MVGCSSDDFVGEIIEPTPVEEELVPINFGSYFKATTRADITGADAAALLGKKFVVSGYKGASTTTIGNMVFDNYLVEWAENTANTTESNTTNWEYVNKGLIKHAIDHNMTSQTIKYWDFSKAQYDFIAWSTGTKNAIYEGTPAKGEVLVSAITPATLGTQAYTFTGKIADLKDCYIADLVTVKKKDYGTNPVTFKFRHLGAKVRIAIYETVPGYSVKNVKFYTKGGVLADPTTEIVNDATLYSTAENIYTEGTYTVTYPTVGDDTKADNNQAHVTFKAKEGTHQSTLVQSGELNYTIAEQSEKTEGKAFLGRSSSTASFAGDAASNYYVVYLPNESGTNLNLRVDYTLESIDGTGEEIEVKSASAQIPSIYTTWKPGYAYTYLFKISDKTNGHTGVYDPTKPDDSTINSDPAGLFPITFDAVVVDEEDGNKTQETITIVSTPSITTYQQNSTVVNADEYTVNGKDIFVTVSEDDKLATLTGKAALYTITAGTTEADVVDALQIQYGTDANGNVKGRGGLVLTKVETNTSLTNSVIYGVDGNEIGVGPDEAFRFTPTANTTYAFVYTQKGATTTTSKYQALAFANFPTGATRYRYDYKTATAGDAKKGVKYFSKTGDVYALVTPFIGQGVSNLYLDATGKTIASGYAVTGTDYYYTDNKGMSYKKAANIAYAKFFGATDLYTFDGTKYVLVTETADGPADGTAYYQKTTSGGVDTYTYCVILPQQTTGWFELDETKYVVATETTAVVGQSYFDKYTQNNGVYYTKVIKVQ